MAFMWAVVIAVLLLFSQKYLHFPARENKEEKLSLKNWIITFVCLIGCKILTFIDWHTLKVVGEIQDKNVYQFCAQYLYYVLEVMLELDGIINTLNKLIDFSGTKVSEEVINQFIYRVTPTSDTTFDWYVNLNGTADVKATFTAEGRKSRAVVKLEEIEQISSLHR